MCACVQVCERVCVCVCASGLNSAVCDTERECNVTLEKEMTCRRVNKTNNIRLFGLFNKRTRYRPVI